ncbi:MAG: class I SAM-dependent methyltransferase [Gemmatimonadales bacterium]
MPAETTARLWTQAYERGMTMWQPQESIVVFAARFLKRREDLRRWTVKRQATRVLDLGCGNGSNARFFAQQGYEAHGIDISSSAIELARTWFADEGLAGDLRVGSCLELPYDDGFFDVVVSHGVLDHLSPEDGLRTMGEVRRVLRPGGLCFLTLVAVNDCEYGKGDPAGRHTFVVTDGYEKGLPQHYFDEADIAELHQGFAVLDLRRIEILFGPELSQRHSRWNVTAERR